MCVFAVNRMKINEKCGYLHSVIGFQGLIIEGNNGVPVADERQKDFYTIYLLPG